MKFMRIWAPLIPAMAFGMFVYVPGLPKLASAQEVDVQDDEANATDDAANDADDADAPAPADADPAKPEPAPTDPAKPEPAPAAEETQPVNIEAAVRGELARVVREMSTLHGVWATVRPDPNDAKKLLVDAIVDEDRAAAQKSELQGILSTLLQGSGYQSAIESTDPRPFTKLISALQMAIEDHSELLGSQVTDGYYSEQDGVLFLNLIGRVANEEQTSEIADLGNEVIRHVLGDALADTTKVEITSLNVVPPSPAVGRYFFNHGTLQFAKKDYAAASQSFSRAILEDPAILSYQYWKVLAELGMENEERAYELLKPLVARRRNDIYSNEYLDVLWSLEHVQGPIRRHLVDLQERAFVESE